MSKKQQKMSLTAFLADESLGAWADDVADLPTAPVVSGTRGDYQPSSGPGADSNRRSAPIPTVPPFQLYMGNLDFEIADRDIEMLFGDLAIKSIRIIRDIQGKPKGFGYVEFHDQKSLIEALKFNNEVRFLNEFIVQPVRNRKIRLDVAEQSSERRSGFGGDDKTGAANWRREGPPPTPAGRPTSESQNNSNWRSGDRPGPPARGGYREERGPRSDRPERPRYGGNEEDPKFAGEWRRETPLAPAAVQREPREFRAPRGEREPREPREPRPPTEADVAGTWRSNKPIVQGMFLFDSNLYPESPPSRKRNERDNTKGDTSAFPSRRGDRSSSARGPREPTKADTADVWRRTGNAPVISGDRNTIDKKRPRPTSASKDVDADGFSTATNSKKSAPTAAAAQNNQGSKVKIDNAFGLLNVDD